MRMFLVGLAFGVALGAAVMAVLDDDSPVAGEDPASQTRADGETGAAELLEALPDEPPSAPELVGRPVDAAAFAPGTAILRIGEGYVFGEDHARPGSEATCDIICQDIPRGGAAVLATPLGSAPARMPLLGEDVDLSTFDLFGLVHDAPSSLPHDSAPLESGGARHASGVWLIAARSGSSVKVQVARVVDSVSALERAVHLRFEVVPANAHGGHVDIPGGIPTRGLAREAGVRLLERMTPPPGLDVSTWGGYAPEAFVRVDETPKDLDISGSQMVIETPLRTHIVSHGPTAIHLPQGLGREGSIESCSFTSLLIDGDMEGKINGRSFGYIHITGDLIGEVEINSKAFLLVDGDVLGTINVRSLGTLFLRGEVPDKRSIVNRSRLTLYLPGYTPERDLAEWPGNEIHLEDSDLPKGRNGGRDGNRVVIVGEEGWKDWQRGD